MRAKQSTTASGMYSRFGTLTSPLTQPTGALSYRLVAPHALAFRSDAPIPAPASSSAPASTPAPDASPAPKRIGEAWKNGSSSPAQAALSDLPAVSVSEAQGLLHDARNLMSALGLYSDLLAQPGVLRTEHRHYAVELALIGTRMAALLERWMDGLAPASPAERTTRSLDESKDESNLAVMAHPPRTTMSSRVHRAGFDHPGKGLEGGGIARFAGQEDDPGGDGTAGCATSIDLQHLVERCAGLLDQVAGGRKIRFSFGDLPSLPVAITEEAAERILVNLVGNAAAALAQRAGSPGIIRIGVGLASPVDPRSGGRSELRAPRLRLQVEDSGCGMTRECLERIERVLAEGGAATGSHGIGLRIVRELVHGSGGRMEILSTPGVGTRIQIEWPIAAPHPGGAQPTTASGKAPRVQPRSTGPDTVVRVSAPALLAGSLRSAPVRSTQEARWSC